MSNKKEVRPTKEAVREYMNQRQKDSSPPSSPEEIRRQLGWIFFKTYSR